ncbi:MAG: transposase [Bacteroidaceae bacterium]|nr:transposase [Bacteroidaceae bacterium]
MNKKSYLCSMNKAEEQQFSILTSELRNERSERQEAQKKAILLERENAVLKSKHADMQRRLNEKMDEVADMVRQMAGYMMGKGPVTLSDSLRNAIVADVREEFESKLREEREVHAREVQSMKDQFAVMLAAKDNEIARLRAKDGDDGASAHGTTTGGSIPDGMTPEDRIRQLERQKAKYAAEAYGQGTESGKYNHGCQEPVSADDLDQEGADVPEERFVEIARKVSDEIRQRKSMQGQRKPRNPQPLIEAAKGDRDCLITLRPENMPEDAYEIGEDVTVRISWVGGHFRCKRIVRKKYRDPRGNYYHVNLPDEYRNPMGREEVTESVIALVYTLHGEHRMTVSEIVTFLRSHGLNYSDGAVKNWIKKAADILAPLDEAIQEEILATGNDHVDESTLEICDRRLPNKDEKEDDVESDRHYFTRWMFCHHAPSIKLTQFVFFERGRRSRKAVECYFKNVRKRLFAHSDGAPMYKCYDVTAKDLEKCSEVADIIIRIACLVHVRRPFFKLRDCSSDAREIVGAADLIFHLDKQIKGKWGGDFNRIAQERVLQIGPILLSIKNMLDILERELDQAKEPELVKAVKYALKEYPCLLHCLQNGALDFSNNCVEREIRRLAKYRNNSFYAGSPEGGVRLARTLTTFANCKAYNIDPYKYLCDVFRRIKNTAKDELVNLVAHRWQPQMAVAAY